METSRMWQVTKRKPKICVEFSRFTDCAISKIWCNLLDLRLIPLNLAQKQNFQSKVLSHLSFSPELATLRCCQPRKRTKNLLRSSLPHVKLRNLLRMLQNFHAKQSSARFLCYEALMEWCKGLSTDLDLTGPRLKLILSYLSLRLWDAN